jgi:hypothetical protein
MSESTGVLDQITGAFNDVWASVSDAFSGLGESTGWNALSDDNKTYATYGGSAIVGYVIYSALFKGSDYEYNAVSRTKATVTFKESC